MTPAYSKAGNMTTIPQPSDPTASYSCTYDAWNRLVKVVDDDTSNTIAEYAYDGRNYRIVQKSYSAGVLDETRHVYYTEPSKWQVVEERVDSSNDPNRQFVWGLRYVDDLVLRDRDTTGNGILNERLYGLQDANWNVTSITDETGTVQERYAYSAYGVPTFLDSSFNTRASSNFAWQSLYAGYHWDALVDFYHVRNRVYGAHIGTWLQRDPLGLSAGINLYQYVSSRPASFADPLGLFRVADLRDYLLGFMNIAFTGTRQCYVLSCGPMPNPALQWCVSVCASADVRACCQQGKTKACIIGDAVVSLGIYAIGSRGPGSAGPKPPPSNWLRPVSIRQMQRKPFSPGRWLRVPLRHGLFAGCPPEGINGQICLVASVGFWGYSAGIRGCISFPSGRTRIESGLGIGIGTGVAVEGGVTAVACGEV